LPALCHLFFQLLKKVHAGEVSPYLGGVVVMQHFGKSVDFFRSMRFLYLCPVFQSFFDLADTRGAETDFRLLHVMQ